MDIEKAANTGSRTCQASQIGPLTYQKKKKNRKATYLERKKEKNHYMFSSQLGLIRCLVPHGRAS